MKIAMLVNEFPPKKVGGVGISTYNTAFYLSKKGHEVHVFTVLEGELPEKDIEVRFHVHRIPRRKIKIIGNLIFSAKIIKELKKINPNIVHIQGLWIGIPGYLAKKILKIPYVVTGHGSDVYLQSKLIQNLRSKPVLRSADAIIALTDHMKKEIESICKRDVFVVPNGINLKEFGNSVKLHNIKKNKKYFLLAH